MLPWVLIPKPEPGALPRQPLCLLRSERLPPCVLPAVSPPQGRRDRDKERAGSYTGWRLRQPQKWGRSQRHPSRGEEREEGLGRGTEARERRGRTPRGKMGRGAWSPQGRGLSPFPEAAGVGVTGVEGSSQPQAQGQEKKGAQRWRHCRGWQQGQAGSSTGTGRPQAWRAGCLQRRRGASRSDEAAASRPPGLRSPGPSSPRPDPRPGGALLCL